MVAITGQVASHLLGTDAFQETDIIGITTPITKWNYQVTSPDEVVEAVVKAYKIANEGRPGPVLIDITKDAQMGMTEYEFPKDIKIDGFQPVTAPNPRQIQFAAEMLNDAKKPLMLVGHGILISHASKELVEFSEKSAIPVASTLHGLSAFPTGHKNYVGYLGMHGNYSPNMLTNQADVILAVGMRFDDRVTGRVSDYAKHAKVIHIDIDPAELNKNIKAEIPIVADAKPALVALSKYIKKVDHSKWIQEFKTMDKDEYEKVIKHDLNPGKGQIKMAEVVNMISEKTKGEAIIVPDVGQHQMVAARYYKFAKPDSFITSGGAGTMGFSLPAAIGAKVAAPKREVVA
jgi:acetolactate synthase-1/2/3 large subunit